MNNKEIALELTKILTGTINSVCSASDTAKNNSLVVVNYYETILELLNSHDERKSE